MTKPIGVEKTSKKTTFYMQNSLMAQYGLIRQFIRYPSSRDDYLDRATIGRRLPDPRSGVISG